jgi:putative ABC transport system permease protein
VPVTFRNGLRAKRGAITGVDPDATLVRLLDAEQRPIEAPPEGGLVLSTKLAELLGVGRGELVTVEVMEERRPVRAVPVAALVEEYFGTSAYMAMAALPRLLGEGPTVSGAYLAVDAAQTDALYRRFKDAPAVASVQLRRDALDSFREVTSRNTLVMTAINTIFAGLIAVGVVYNTARIALAERGRELASLRVLGFTRGEVSYILLGELALLTVLALPLGCAIGFGLAALIASLFDSEVYRIPLVVAPATYGYAVLVVVVAAALSALAVRRRIDRLDLVAVLKTRE